MTYGAMRQLAFDTNAYRAFIDGNRTVLDYVLYSPDVGVPITVYGEIYAGLRRIGKPMRHNDIWIAALCKQYGYPLITADRGFENVTGLEVVLF